MGGERLRVFSNGKMLILSYGKELYIANQSRINNCTMNFNQPIVDITSFSGGYRQVASGPATTTIEMSITCFGMETRDRAQVNMQELFQVKEMIQKVQQVRNLVTKRRFDFGE